MKFCMVADRPGWCFDRTAQALIKYHNSEHEWSVVYAVRNGGRWIPYLPEADAYRFGGIHIWALDGEARIPIPPGKAVFPTFASFSDFDPVLGQSLEARLGEVTAFIINDRRMLLRASEYGKPLIYSPDRTDHEIFYPEPQLRPSGGALRIGWAGSVRAWGNSKHVGEILQACRTLAPRVKFIRQDREKDGWLSANRMREWFNKLDLYVVANDTETCTPVPSLEAIACGVPVATTECGELWPLIRLVNPYLIIRDGNVKEVLNYCANLGRRGLAELGIRLRSLLSNNFVTWRSGEAGRVTELLARLVTSTCEQSL